MVKTKRVVVCYECTNVAFVMNSLESAMEEIVKTAKRNHEEILISRWQDDEKVLDSVKIVGDNHLLTTETITIKYLYEEA